jgi:hypothetical protein
MRQALSASFGGILSAKRHGSDTLQWVASTTGTAEAH